MNRLSDLASQRMWQVLVISSLMLGFAHSAEARDTRLRPEIAPAIRYFETVDGFASRASLARRGGVATRHLTVTFQTLGKEFTLDLEPNELFTPNARNVWVGSQVRQQRVSRNVLYKGTVQGQPESWARVRVRNGVMDGMIWTPEETYFVEHRARFFRGATGGGMVAYRLSDTDSDWSPGSCALDDTRVRQAMQILAHQSGGAASSAELGQAAAATLKRADIGIIADYEYYLRHGANAASDMQSILNQADGIYQSEVGVTLQVTKTVVFSTASDPFSNTDPNGLLEDLTTYLSGPDNQVAGTDLAHLFTGRNLDGNTIGTAYLGTLCNSVWGAGLSQDYTTDNKSLVLLTAHEIGHNFNAPHDNETGSPCESTPFGYIMNPQVSTSLNYQFSACSKLYILPEIASVACLSSVSSTPTPTPTPTFAPTLTATPTPTRTRTPTPAPQAASQDLTALLNAPGTTVSLNAANVYTISEYPLSVNKTLLCNGATIQSTGGPIRVSGTGVQFIVDNCVIQGTGWALLGALSGADLVVRNNTRLTGNGTNSGIYVDGSTLDMTGGSITSCRWGVNMLHADALIHGVSITNTTYGVQNVAGTVTMDSGCHLQNVNAGNPGTGVALIASPSYPSRAAAAVIHNSTFAGFGNAVDIQPTAAQGLLPGTAEILGCRFDDPFYSALSVVDAVNVRFADSQVNRAKADGIFLVNSTGVVENSQVLGSLNTGVTFQGCQNGATIRNSLVSGSVHQGVAVVADPSTGRVSSRIQILDNTLKDNVIANLLVDNRSDALVQGNILSGVPSPNFSLRLHGSPTTNLVGNLLLDSYRGLEMKDGARSTAALSVFTGHDRDGALVYANATANFIHCAHQANLQHPVSGDASVFANTGGRATLRRCSLGPAGSTAFYNNAGNTAIATNTYWASASGPAVPGGGGSGALIGWNTTNGSAVTYQPFLAAAPLDFQVNRTVNLTAGTTTSWAPYADLALSLTGAPGITAVSGGVAAALRVRDTSTVTMPAPLGGTLSDGMFAVWANYDLLSRSQSGSLRLRTVGPGATAALYRLQPDGSWLPLPTTWSAGTAEIIYNASDPRTLNGVFSLVDLPPNRQTLAEQLITSFYQDILGRAPEPGAVDAWYNGYFAYSLSFGIDVRFVPREIGRIFFLSSEYASRNRTNAQFITDCYQAFLHRQPSASELSGWLSGVWNRPEAMTLFAESAEFAAYIDGLFPELSGVPTRNFVTTMYIGLLDRIVDAGGLSYWASLFEWDYASGGIEGVRAEAVRMGRSVVASAEYQGKQPTNQTHVVRFYRAYLGRFPNTDEIAYWQGELDAGRQTTDTLIGVFAASAEFTGRLNTYFGSL